MSNGSLSAKDWEFIQKSYGYGASSQRKKEQDEISETERYTLRNPVPEEQGFFGDVVDSVQMGAWQGASDLARGLGAIFDSDWLNKTADWAARGADENMQTMSSKMRSALGESAFDGFDDETGEGKGVLNAYWWAGNIGSLIGQNLDAALTLGAGKVATSGVKMAGKAAGKFFTKETAEQVSKAAIKEAEKRGAPNYLLRTIGLTAAQSAMAAGSRANQVRDEIDELGDEKLAQLEGFRQTYWDLKNSEEGQNLDHNTLFDEAKERFKFNAGRDAALDLGAIATDLSVNAISGLGGGVWGAKFPPFGNTQSISKGIAKGVGIEAGTEALQGAVEQRAINETAQQFYDPTRDINQDVSRNAIDGAILGGAFGGAMGGIEARSHRNTMNREKKHLLEAVSTGDERVDEQIRAQVEAYNRMANELEELISPQRLQQVVDRAKYREQVDAEILAQRAEDARIKANTPYHQRNLADIQAEFIQNGFDENDFNDFVEANLQQATTELQNLQTNPFKMGADFQKGLAEKQAYNAKLADAQARVDYFTRAKNAPKFGTEPISSTNQMNTPPSVQQGANTSIELGTQGSRNASYELVEAGDLNVNLKPNQYQNRDRTSIDSQMQISAYASKLNPAYLGASVDVTQGAPTVDGRYGVFAGNGRLSAIKQAYAHYPQQAAGYKQFLADNASSFGFSAEQVEAMQNPVLIRKVNENFDVTRAVEDSNYNTGLDKGVLGTAKETANHLTNDLLREVQINEDGTLNLSESNTPFIQTLLSRIPVEQRPKFFAETRMGNQTSYSLTAQGRELVENALLVKAYENAADPTYSQNLLTDLIVSTDEQSKRVKNALISIAGKVIQTKGNLDFDISQEINEAYALMRKGKQAGLSVDEALAQQDFVDPTSPRVKALARLFYSPKSVKDVQAPLNHYLDSVIHSHLDQVEQNSMFGDELAISKDELLRDAGFKFSRSAMKSVEANIARGREAMTKAILDKSSVHRAMYRNDLDGWIDFEWGDVGKMLPNGKTKGAMGLSHIIDKRMAVDGMSEQEVTRFLVDDITETIAKGTIERENVFEKTRTVQISYNGNEVRITKKQGNNGWVVTGFKQYQPMNQSRGATTSDLRNVDPIRSRIELGAVGTENLPSFANDVKFSRSAPQDYVRDLMVTHNISPEGILHAQKMGGLPYASVAVAKQDNPLTGFGDVTLIGDRHYIDPKGENKAKVFGADIYSPRYPDVTYEYKESDKKVLQKLFEQSAKEIEDNAFGYNFAQGLSQTGVRKALLESDAVKYQFLKENGIAYEPAYRTVAKSHYANFSSVKKAIELGLTAQDLTDNITIAQHENLLREFIREEIQQLQQSDSPLVKRAILRAEVALNGDLKAVKDHTVSRLTGALNNQTDRQEFDAILTKSNMRKAVEQHKTAFNQYVENIASQFVAKEKIRKGENRNGEATYMAHTLENVVKKLKKDLLGGESMNYGLPSIRSKVTPKFKSIEDIQKNKDRLVSRENFEKVRDEIEAEKDKLAEDLGVNTWDIDDVLWNVVDENVSAAFHYADIENTPQNRQLVANFLAKLKAMPTEYFEGKAKDITQFSDFKGAVIPQNLDPAVRQVLEQAGLPLYEYDRTNPSARAEIIKQASNELDILHNGDVLFSRAANKPERLEKLRQSQPIEITGTEIKPSDDIREYKRNALEYGKSLRGSYVNKDTGKAIELGAGGVKEILQHDYKDIEHLQSIAAIPQIIENAIYIDTLPNEDVKNPHINAYEYYVAGLKIDGVDYTVKAAVGISPYGDRYYDHKLTKIEKGKLLEARHSDNKSGVPQQQIALGEINDKRLLQILQPKNQPFDFTHEKSQIATAVGKGLSRHFEVTHSSELGINDPTIEAAYNTKTGKIVIIADNIRANSVLSREERLKWVAWHELAHRGLQVRFGGAFRDLMQTADRNSTVNALATALQKDRSELKDNRILAVEEAIAELHAAYTTGKMEELKSRYGLEIPLGKEKSLKAWFKMTAERIREVMAKLFGLETANRFSHDDLLNLLKDIQQSAGGDVNGVESDVRHSLNEDPNSSFAKAVERIEKAGLSNPKRYINMGTTPPVLQMLGLDEVKIAMRESVINKALFEHSVTAEDLKRLPEQINNPVAIMRSNPSSMNPNGLVVLTELSEVVNGKDKPLIAALQLKHNGDALEVINISSVYGRDWNTQIGNDLSRTVYWNKTKGYQFARSGGLQLPNMLTSVDNLSAFNIKTEADLSQYQNSDLRFSRSQSNVERLRGLNQPTKLDNMKDVAKAMANRPLSEWKSLMLEYGKKANTKIFDALAPIKYAEDKAGITDHSQSAYTAARLAAGSASIAEASMLYGLPEYREGIIQRKNGTTEKDALFGILQALGNDANDFLAWVAGNRADKLMQEGRENHFSQAEIDELKALNRGREQRFEQARQKLMAWNQSLLDLAEHSGLINQEDRAKWEDKDFYIPFYREDDDGDAIAPYRNKGLSGQNAGIKRLKGSDKAINDLLENVITNATKLIDASVKNAAMTKAVTNLADTGVISLIENPTYADWKKLGSNKHGADKDGGVAMVRIEGKEQMVRINDAMLFNAITSIDQQPLDYPFRKLFAGPKRVLTSTVTSMPNFIIRNFLRDMAQAWVVDRNNGFKLGMDSIKGLKDAYKRSGSSIDLMFAGASFGAGYVNGGNPEQAATQIRRYLRKQGKSVAEIDGFMDGVIFTKDKLGSVLDKYFHLSHAAENANRIAVYDRAIASGKSKAQAALESKDLMDFSMHGSAKALRVLGDVLPFFNARLQGMSQLGRAFKDNPRELAKRGAMIALASVALAAMNQGEEWYEEQSDEIKDNFWLANIGGQIIKIPKPFELGVVFGTVPERLFRTMSGADDTGRFKDRLLSAISNTLSLNPIPQAVKPIFEVYNNYDSFRGREIETLSDRRLLKEARFDDQTSLFSRGIAGVTSVFGLSPKQTDHLIHGYFGTLGMYVLGMSDVAIRQAGGYGELPAKNWSEYPVLDAVFGGDVMVPRKYTRYMNDYYHFLNQVSEISATVNSYKADGRKAEAKLLLAENQRLLAYKPVISQTQKELKAIKAKMDAIQNNGNLSAAEKRQRLDRLRENKNAIVRTVVERMEKEDF